MWSPSDRESILGHLSELLLSPGSTKDIIIHFQVIVLELILRAKKQILTSNGKIKSYQDHQRFCIALSKVLQLCPEMSR